MNHTNKEIDKWIIDNTNKHLCGCKCGHFIKIERRYYNIGIPKYIYGHGKRNENILVFIEGNSNKHICLCGCNQFIKIIRNHYWGGIPKYISGHNPSTDDSRRKQSESLKKYYLENEYPESAKEKIRLGRMGDKNWSKLPEVRKKQSESRNEYLRNGGTTWNKGLTKETDNVVKRMAKQKMGKNNPMYGKLPSIMSGRGKGSYYNSPLQGKIWLRSTYELAYAKYLDSINELWYYEIYAFDLCDTTYIPDFYLPRLCKFVEIKGYMTDKNIEKINHFLEIYHCNNFDILYQNDLIKLGVL